MITPNDILLAWIGMLPGAHFGDTAEAAIESAYVSIPAIHIGVPQFMSLDDFAASLKRIGYIPKFHKNNYKLALPESGFGVHHQVPRHDIVRLGAQPGRWWVRQVQTDASFFVSQAARLGVRQADVLYAAAALGWTKAAIENLAPSNAQLLFESAP